MGIRVLVLALLLARQGVAQTADSARWQAAGHRLGRGRLRPENVVIRNGAFRLRIVPGRCDGAEVRTVDRVGFGEYIARMRTPHAPGSISAFFLYADVPSNNDEIDLEVHNDGSRRAILTTWIAGKQTRTAEVRLPFDPEAAVHTYAIRWTERALTFLADDAELERWTKGIPHSPMRLMANLWWPTWLSCQPIDSPRELFIEGVQLATPFPVVSGSSR